jgi:hypothetical protein
MTERRVVLKAAQQLKHEAFVARKAARARAARTRDSVWARRTRGNDFRFELARYRDHAGFFPFDFFLHRDADPTDVDTQSVVPRVVYSTWTGNNPMSRDRARALDDFRRANEDVDHRLVTRDNLDEHLVPEAPLHAAFDSLSENHKSDYLRCYLLHFHGGGYSDVKGATSPWSPVFNGLDQDPDAWVVGYPEPSSQIADNLHDPLRRDLKHNFARLVGNGAFLVRARTALTCEWYAEVLRRLDYHQRDLAEHPARDPFGRNEDYPVTWVGLQGLVFHPLQLKHLAHVRQDVRLTPSFTAFR